MPEENPIDPEMLKQFIDDAIDMLGRTDAAFAALEANGNDKDAIHEMFRIAHNLKGNSGYMNFTKMNSLAHRLEELLLVIRDKDNLYSEEVSSVLRKGMEKLKAMVRDCAQPETEDPEYLPLINEINRVADETKNKDITGLWNNLSQDINLLTEKLGNVEPELTDILMRIIFSIAALSPVGKEEKKPEDKPAAEPAKDKPAAASAQKTVIQKAVKIDDTRLAELLGTVKELEAALAALPQDGNIPENLRPACANFREISRKVAQQANSLRLVPATTLFNRAPLMVKDIARKQQKVVKVELSGVNVLIDKTHLEAIEAPFTHIVRNAIDHGIEMPEDRKAKGKPECGLFQITVADTERTVQFIFKDDGKGIDADAVKWKAITKGLLPADKASTVTKEEIYLLLFMPGFSTADRVTDISGRGVGMDVVKTNVEGIGGTVSVSSEVGKGTQITLSIPKTK